MGLSITKTEMYNRTLAFATRVAIMLKSVPKGYTEDNIVKQLAKSSSSVGANYREACHAKSPEDFASKLKICEGEADETLYWLQLLANTDIIPEKRLRNLIQEARELVAILTASTKTAYSRCRKKSNVQNSKSTNRNQN